MNDDWQVETSTFNLDTPRLRAQIISTMCLSYGAFWAVMTFAFVAFGLYFRGSVFPAEVKKFTLVAFTLVPLYFGVIFALSGRKMIKRTFRRFRDVPGAGLYRAKFNPDSLYFESDAGVISRVPMILVTKIVTEKVGIMVYLDAYRLMWIPREAFASQEQFDLASKWCLEAQLSRIGPGSNRLG